MFHLDLINLWLLIALLIDIIVLMSIWRPNFRGDIDRMERVQHKVLRKLASLTDNVKI